MILLVIIKQYSIKSIFIYYFIFNNYLIYYNSFIYFKIVFLYYIDKKYICHYYWLSPYCNFNFYLPVFHLFVFAFFASKSI